MQTAAEQEPVLEAGSTLTPIDSLPIAGVKTPEELANIVAQFASSDGWINRVRLCAERRWYERLYHSPNHDIWAISWLLGQSTGFHDHGGSAGAFIVASWVLEEHRPGGRTRDIFPGEARAFGATYAHDVLNVSLAPAISIHAYSPPLNDMNEYELDGDQLVPLKRAPKQDEWNDAEWRAQGQKSAYRVAPSSIDQVLSTARVRLSTRSRQESMLASMCGKGWSMDSWGVWDSSQLPTRFFISSVSF